MIELGPMELCLFGVGCFIIGNIVFIVVVWICKLISDWGDGTIRKRPSPAALCGLSKDNDTA